MINIDLSWQQAAILTTGLALTAAILLRQDRPARQLAARPGQHPGPHPEARANASRRRRRLATAGVFVREAALICGLFTLWQFAGSESKVGRVGAYSRGHWLWDAERALHLPNEASVQGWFLPHPLLIQFLNFYYDILHFPVLIGCMIWLFIARRDRYPRFRTTLVAFTGICLLIQLIPVAPPRLLAGPGLVDTALRYGQSVYDPRAGFEANQFSAMPSVHVGWAILVAIGVIGAARTRWRWLAVLYSAMTLLVVVVTANHYWLDGIAAALIIVIVLPIQAVMRRLWARRKAARHEAAQHEAARHEESGTPDVVVLPPDLTWPAPAEQRRLDIREPEIQEGRKR